MYFKTFIPLIQIHFVVLPYNLFVSIIVKHFKEYQSKILTHVACRTLGLVEPPELLFTDLKVDNLKLQWSLHFINYLHVDILEQLLLCVKTVGLVSFPTKLLNRQGGIEKCVPPTEIILPGPLEEHHMPDQWPLQPGLPSAANHRRDWTTSRGRSKMVFV